MPQRAVKCAGPCLSVRVCTRLALIGIFAAACAADEVGSPATSTEDPQYLVTFWSTEDGLPSNTISDLVQTRDGYLWASTYDGLVRFDGVRFVRAGPPESIDRQASRILCLHLDQHDQLWLGTDGAGLLRYDGERFHTFLPAEPGSPLNVVRALAEDKAGNLWLGTRGGLGRWRDGKVTWFTPTEVANAANSVWNLAFDREERLWITDWVSLKSFKEGAFESALIRPEARVPLRAVYTSTGGDLWVGMLGQALHRNPAGDWKPIGEARGFGNSEVTAFCETSSHELWLGARKGLYQWRGGSWVPLKRDRLEVTEVRVLFEDREGNLWVGTGTAGLVRLKRPSVRTFAAADGLGDGPVLAVRQKRDGGLWVGLSDGGIAEQKGERFMPWQPSPAGSLPFRSIDAPVKSILRTRDGAIWVGTFGNGLTRFQDGQSVRFVPSVGTFARVDKITSLLEDHKGDVWVGTFYSLYRLSESNVLVQVPVGGHEVLAQVMALLDTGAGLWVAFDGVGVARISGNQAFWLTRREGLPTHFVRALHEDAEGNLWIGTTAGLCCWRDGAMETWTTEQGLISDAILQILEDNDGNLWLGSKAGIMRVAKADLKAVAERRKALTDVFAFGRGEGMISVECSGGFCPSAAKTSDGKFWFPTAKGLVMVDTSRITHASNPSPPVHIEEVRADGKVVARPHISPAAPGNSGRAATTALPYDTRRLEFIYTAPGLATPERVRFRHRLKNFDSDWADAGTARSAVYTKLTPGEYRFEVMACNNDGVWSEAARAHAFRIMAPFWKTGWFLGLAGLATAGSIGTMVRFVSVRHLRRKLWRLEQAHAIEKERMRIAQDMHDEIGGKLSRISFLSDMASRGLPEKSEASQQIEEVSEAAREVIRTVDEIVWAVSPRNDTLDSAIHYICRHAEEFFELTPIELQLELPEEVPVLRLSTEVRHNLFCAVKEALNNALKHAQATNVRITFTTARVVPNAPPCFQIVIADNGRGFCVKELFGAGVERAQASALTGDGLLNMRERLQSIGGTCTVESQTGNGARVTFTIPLRP